MTLKELFALKGEAITEIEAWQARLNQVNKLIVDEKLKPVVKDEPKPE